MKVLFLCTDIYGGHGGIALFNRDLVAAVAAMPEVDDVVVVPRLIVRSSEHQDEIPPNVEFAARAARGRVAYMATLAGILRRHRFDLVICGHVNLLPIAWLTGQAPLLLTYGIEVWKPLRDPLSNRLLHKARGIVSVSKVTCDRLVSWSHFAGATFVLPNAVRQERYGIRPKKPELVARYGLEGKRVILTLGRIVTAERYKGFDEMIEVLPRLPDDIVYVAAGSGSDVERLRAKAQALGVAKRVIFTGFVPEEEKADLYNLADVYAMPSRGEGFGFVFLEAMACGVPAIASAHDGGREALLEGLLGTLVDPSSLAEIAIAVEDALTFGTRKIPDYLDYFSFANFEKRVQHIIRAVVDRGDAAPALPAERAPARDSA